MFSLYQNTGGTPTAILGCPIAAGCANRQSVSHSSDDHEEVQTARVDYNISEKDTTWFRFQADTGLQAAWTDPINPIFNALLAAASLFVCGRTHPRLLAAPGELFQSGVLLVREPVRAERLSEDTFGLPDRITGQRANPFTPIGGLDNTWVQGRRASRFSINDNLAWSHGAHELRFGTNTRIFRLNDYDLGEGTVPTVTYATCSNLSMEWRTRLRRRFRRTK